MCRYCDALTDDKDVVHAFVERAAERASESVGRTVGPDELDLDFGNITWNQIGGGHVPIAAQSLTSTNRRPVVSLFR